MKLLLHLIITEDRLFIPNPLRVEGLVYANMDNFSEAPVVEVTLQAIHQAAVVVAFIEGGGPHVGSIPRVLKTLHDFEHLLIINNTAHPIIDRMITHFGTRVESHIPPATLDHRIEMFMSQF